MPSFVHFIHSFVRSFIHSFSTYIYICIYIYIHFLWCIHCVVLYLFLSIYILCWSWCVSKLQADQRSGSWPRCVVRRDEWNAVKEAFHKAFLIPGRETVGNGAIPMGLLCTAELWANETMEKSCLNTKNCGFHGIYSWFVIAKLTRTTCFTGVYGEYNYSILL